MTVTGFQRLVKILDLLRIDNDFRKETCYRISQHRVFKQLRAQAFVQHFTVAKLQKHVYARALALRLANSISSYYDMQLAG